MSCLFNSLGSLIHKDAQSLRANICNYIAQNKELMEGVNAQEVVTWENGQSLDQYVQGMRSPATWGGAIEISAFVNMYCVPVTVLDLRTSKKIHFVPKRRTRKKALCLTWNGAHYEAIKE